MKQLYPSEKKNVGYTFSHKQFSVADGFPNLFVYLREEPSHTHFDPEMVTFTAAVHGELRQMTIRFANAPLSEQFTVVAGRIILTDRKQQRVEFFTFGGTMMVGEKPGMVQCMFISTAPIFLLEESESPRALFAEEVEILLAERRANSDNFEEKLASVDPFRLFAALLKATEAKVEKLPYRRVKKLSKLHAFVVEEVQLLNEFKLFPDGMLSLTELLG